MGLRIGSGRMVSQKFSLCRLQAMGDACVSHPPLAEGAPKGPVAYNHNMCSPFMR